MPISELGVGDRDLALQRGEPRFLIGVVSCGDLVVELLVNSGIDAADKEARHAGDARGIAALRNKGLETGEISFQHLGIDLLREQQGNIDVDAFGEEFADRRQALAGAGHLDHQILAVDVAPQFSCLGDRALRIKREIGRDLQTDEAVGAIERVINRSQHVRRALDILDRQRFVQVGDRAIALLDQRR